MVTKVLYLSFVSTIQTTCYYNISL